MKSEQQQQEVVSMSSGCSDIFIGSGERPETTAIKLAVAQWLWNTKKARIIVPEFRLDWRNIVDVAAAVPKPGGWETHLIEVKISVSDLRRDIVTKADVEQRRQEIWEVFEIADAVWRQWVLGCRTKFGIDPIWNQEWYRRSYRRDHDWAASLQQQMPLLSDYDEISRIRRGGPPKGLPPKKVGKLADPWFRKAATFLWVATDEERVATKVMEKEDLDPVGVLFLRDGKLRVRRRATRNEEPWLKRERFLREAARNLTQRMLQHAGFEVTIDGIHRESALDRLRRVLHSDGSDEWWIDTIAELVGSNDGRDALLQVVSQGGRDADFVLAGLSRVVPPNDSRWRLAVVSAGLSSKLVGCRDLAARLVDEWHTPELLQLIRKHAANEEVGWLRDYMIRVADDNGGSNS